MAHDILLAQTSPAGILSRRANETGQILARAVGARRRQAPLDV
ncbi:MAG TPA: hypothetical protein VES67_02300 [Vicinamibacterales bacterium]|nr:hypothetical protein [Vicinamibacterales bacterium]